VKEGFPVIVDLKVKEEIPVGLVKVGKEVIVVKTVLLA